VERCENHEDVSIEIATKFLKENNYPDEKIQKIVGCIDATRYPQNPKNLLEEIICDAKDFAYKADLLRVEW
jgi:hypothetical protein